MQGWIGVDLDGTLAYFDEWRGPDHIGAPIPRMLERVKKWLAEGRDIRIFTARCIPTPTDEFGTNDLKHTREVIEAWCFKHLGRVLPITGSKDYGMIELWDDRCRQVVPNTGVAVGEVNAHLIRTIDKVTDFIGDRSDYLQELLTINP